LFTIVIAKSYTHHQYAIKIVLSGEKIKARLKHKNKTNNNYNNYNTLIRKTESTLRAITKKKRYLLRWMVYFINAAYFTKII